MIESYGIKMLFMTSQFFGPTCTGLYDQHLRCAERSSAKHNHALIEAVAKSIYLHRLAREQPTLPCVGFPYPPPV